MKSILFIVHYFYPDYASTGQIMTELCLELQKRFKITVIAVNTGYSNDLGKSRNAKNEKLEDIDIIRVSAVKPNKKSKLSRIIHMTSYFVNAIYKGLTIKKHDFVFVISQPPILGGLLGAIIKVIKGSTLIYNIQDFNPEQTEAVQYSRNKFVLKLARVIDNITCKSSDCIVLVGNDMKRTLLKRLPKINDSKVKVINNWIDEEHICPLSKEHPRVKQFITENQLEDKFIIMYSGNIGLYYDLENIIEVIARFRDNMDVAFVFIGDGAIKDKLVHYCINNKITNVKFLPYQNKEDLVFSLNAADVHLITNKKGIKGVSVPSKIYGVMAAGKFALGVLEEGSEASDLIKASDSGVVVEPEDYEGLYIAIDGVIKSDRHLIATAGMNGRTYLDKNLKKAQAIEKYETMLENF